jgi:hypothetical protein
MSPIRTDNAFPNCADPLNTDNELQTHMPLVCLPTFIPALSAGIILVLCFLSDYGLDSTYRIITLQHHAVTASNTLDLNVSTQAYNPPVLAATRVLLSKGHNIAELDIVQVRRLFNGGDSLI